MNLANGGKPIGDLSRIMLRDSERPDVVEVLAPRPELGEVALFRMANGSKLVILQDQREETWQAYCAALRKASKAERVSR